MRREKRIELISPLGESVKCRIADTFWSRFIGLMGQEPLPEGQGILIRPCNSIHMFMMKFSIDAIFLDRDFNVIKLIRNLNPGSFSGTVSKAWQVLEITAGNTPPSFSEGVSLRAIYL